MYEKGLTGRLGWTGDLQAFAPTASFLYDTAGFLANWLHDLSEEQIKDWEGIVPLVVPDTLSQEWGPNPQAVWVSSSGGCARLRLTARAMSV